MAAKKGKKKGYKKNSSASYSVKPGTQKKTYYYKNAKVMTGKKHGYKKNHHHRKNPDTLPATMDPMNNIGQYALGILGGTIVIPMVSSLMNQVGPMNYAITAGMSIGGYYVLKNIAPKAGLAVLISGLTVTALQIEKDYNVLQGLRGLLGWTSPAQENVNGFTPRNMQQAQIYRRNLAYANRMAGIIPYGQPGGPGVNGIIPYASKKVNMMGMIPYGQNSRVIPLNSANVDNGFDKNIF